MQSLVVAVLQLYWLSAQSSSPVNWIAVGDFAPARQNVATLSDNEIRIFTGGETPTLTAGGEFLIPHRSCSGLVVLPGAVIAGPAPHYNEFRGVLARPLGLPARAAAGLPLSVLGACLHAGAVDDRTAVFVTNRGETTWLRVAGQSLTIDRVYYAGVACRAACNVGARVYLGGQRLTRVDPQAGGAWSVQPVWQDDTPVLSLIALDSGNVAALVDHGDRQAWRIVQPTDDWLTQYAELPATAPAAQPLAAWPADGIAFRGADGSVFAWHPSSGTPGPAWDDSTATARGAVARHNKGPSLFLARRWDVAGYR